MSILHLTLKKKWFDMIASGEKKEEYREIKPYWVHRLLMDIETRNPQATIEYVIANINNANTSWSFCGYDVVRFRNGYKKNAPAIDVKIEGFEVGRGVFEWGAEEPRKEYFIIKLGKILSK